MAEGVGRARNAVVECRAACAGAVESRGAGQEAKAEKLIPAGVDGWLIGVVVGGWKIGAISF